MIFYPDNSVGISNVFSLLQTQESYFCKEKQEVYISINITNARVFVIS